MKRVDTTTDFHGHPDYLKLTEEELELHSKKNKDYTHDGDPLGNFKRVSAILKIWGFDIPPELVALIYALKQQDAYMWMISQGYEGQVEGIEERLQDDYIYKKLARVLVREKKKDSKIKVFFKCATCEYYGCGYTCKWCTANPDKVESLDDRTK